MKKVLNIFTTVLLASLVVLVVFVFYQRITGSTPRLFGYQLYKVISGSMVPKYQIGDMILVKAIDPNELKKGDIISYRGEEGEYNGKIISHQIVEDPRFENGVLYFQTKGIIENAPYDPIITEDQVLGIVIKKMPILTVIYGFFETVYGLIFVLAVLGYMLFVEIMNLNKLIKEN